jgi:hypothetical protein
MGGAVAETYEAVNPCAECGYDLGPNYIEAYDGDTCPECGTPFERVNVTPEPNWGHDDDDDDSTMAEQCSELLDNGDSEYLALTEFLTGSSTVTFHWPDGWDWSFVRRCTVYYDCIEIEWTDGSESSLDRPYLQIDNESIDTTGDVRIERDGNILYEY